MGISEGVGASSISKDERLSETIETAMSRAVEKARRDGLSLSRESDQAKIHERMLDAREAAKEEYRKK